MATDDTKAMGRHLRQLREAAGLSQRELAQRLDCQQPAIARLEAGGVMPNLTTLRRIADALELELQVQMISREQALATGVPAAMRRRRS
jgi:predicted transcriptional regulator